MIIFGIIGLILISYAIWIKKEIKQDLFFLFGGISLLIYSIYIDDIIFIVLQIVYILSVLFELRKLKHSQAWQFWK